MSFLDALKDQISNQFSLGENTTHTLDSVIDGQQKKYGSLGDYARKFDSSAERRYIEEGYLRRDPFNTDSKKFEILVQEPSATVFVKKRMFSSVAENFRPDYMDKDEFLYYKATKILFANKCRQIAAMEKLSKIQKITSTIGEVDNQLIPLVITLADTVREGLSRSNAFGSSGGNGGSSDFNSVIDRLRKIYGMNTANNYTSWITDTSNIFNIQHGAGTGVIEITNFSQLNTTTTVDIAQPGSFSLKIMDPYEFMLITEYDIERAIADASNSFYNHQSFQFGLQSANDVINNAQNQFNQARRARGASQITFKVNPDTLLGKRVTAIIDRTGTELVFNYDSTGGTGFPGLGGAGGGVSVSDEYLKGGEIAGFDGLDTNKNTKLGPDNNIKKLFAESEYDIFKRLVTAIFNKISLEANSKNAFQTTNRETNYARKKMRFNFSGHSIIQPMDVVHIYMSSKSRFDANLMSGVNEMFTGLGLLQKINNVAADLTNSFNALFNPSNSISLQAEKAVYVGAEFPNYLWNLMRSEFVTEKEGTHVFAGVVETVNDDYSPGKFEVNVAGKDNTIYFNQGKVNFKPGVDAFNGYFFDPLTPFETKFDNVGTTKERKLLPENEVLLGTNQDESFVKFKLGPFAGTKARKDNILMNGSYDPISGQNFKTFYAPDGLVYKWKEGIGIFTQNGSSQYLNGVNKTGSPNLFAEPFAGLDVMNVLSLLVTGIPYNFATYFKVTQNVNGFSKDLQSAQNAAHTYFGSLSGDLSKRNVLWGNFIPFKSLIMDEQTYIKALTDQSRITQINTKLEEKIAKLSDLNNYAVLNGLASALTNKSEAGTTKSDEISKLKDEINKDISEIQDQDKAFYQKYNIDSSFDVGDFIGSDKENTSISNVGVKKYLRRKINYLTRKMSYDVRANEDKNFFIVDDVYDKDYDLAAYNQGLTKSLSIYGNDFANVRDKIAMTAQLLNLEVFCDTQGHIRVRPPQYNRMPSSVFYRMMYLKQSMGIQIFPQFISDFFEDQINALQTRIEVIEDQIRLDCAILSGILGDNSASLADDQYALAVIRYNNTLDKSGQPFLFMSDSTDGRIINIGEIIKKANIDPEDRELLNDFKSDIEGQANSNKITYTNTQKVMAIRQALDLAQDNAANSVSNSVINSQTVTNLIKRINRKSGQQLSPRDYIASDINPFSISYDSKQSVDLFKVTKELGEKIKERQTAIKLFYNAIKNMTELRSLDNDESTGNALLMPGNYGNSQIPETFEHMIEDETYDDYGIGSGKRFVIKRSQIRSLNVGANAPEYTSVEVQGILNTFAPEALPPGLTGSFPGGGNSMVTAMAIDYDTWRNFGFKAGNPIKVPFLSDPDTQCGPYASMLLSIARRNILRGTLTISGNEFMQPGEVIYLEDRGMLFYVNSVQHSMSMGSGFTTTLTLSYGHTPGEYIPTPLDIIGKLIYKNKETSEIIVQRQERSRDESSMGVVQRYKNNKSVLSLNGMSGMEGKDPTFDKPETAQSLANLFQTSDIAAINNVLYNAAYSIHTNNISGNTTKAKVELRIYYNNKSGTVDPDLKALADLVKDILTNGREDIVNLFKEKNSLTPTLPKFNPGTSKGDENETVKVVQVNLDEENERRTPSQKAINIARRNINNVEQKVFNSDGTASDASENLKIRRALFAYVIDIWLSIEDVPPNQINKGQ